MQPRPYLRLLVTIALLGLVACGGACWTSQRVPGFTKNADSGTHPNTDTRSIAN